MILGFGGAPLWAAKCTYLTISGNRHAQIAKKEAKDIINQYFGVFFLIFQSSGIWGNLISSLILGQTEDSGPDVNESNYTNCGANDCLQLAASNINNTDSKLPKLDLIYTLLGVYTGCGVLAVLLVCIFLENTDHKEDLKDNGKKEPIWVQILATFWQLKDIRQLLLIPLTMWSGFEQGFLAGDYTKSYVTCALGIHFVGYVMICFAATNAFCSLLFGKLSQYTGRVPLFSLAVLANVTSIIALLFWKPHPNQFAVFFIFPAIWGMADAVWQTQTNSLYGVLFDDHKEAGFANYRLWESLGFVVAYGYNTFLCVSVKLYILLSVLLLGITLFAVVEYREKRKMRRSRLVNEEAIQNYTCLQTKM